MDLVVTGATFAFIFLAELPDKSMLTAIVLGTRYRALPVWLGLASAFLVHVLIATTAGGLLTRLPEKWVAGAVTAFFLTFALLLLFRASDETDEANVDKPTTARAGFTKVFALAFAAVFITEWGDLTQLATISLTARYDNPISVGLGSLSALWLISGLGVLFGGRILSRLPIKTVKRISGLVLLALAIWSAVDFARLF